MKIEIDIPDDELRTCVSCGSGEMNLTLNVNETIDGYDITSIVSDTYDGNASLKYKKIEDWTNCSDNLPDMDVDVLGTTKRYGDVVKVARWETTLEASGWEWMLTDDIEGNAYKPDEIIAWMPLPEGYKEGK